ncbi:metallophosphoesterase family protein [Halogranum rubrum]|uniref:Phosphoesterase n=1 Tax=Halogranum salarium B-1 TaxID=1210908 RepID=J3JEF4_9EURY|nr:metallophosphoesterase family protein [Halogranum salarium]EJN58314.1 phosphoesterase, mj0936 family [Halogranum salarium B-1]
MPTELALVSDTHVPGRASSIPEWIREKVEAADHTVHAGDFDAPETLELVESLAGGSEQFTGVRGNVDGVRVDLPEVATVTVEGVTFVVTHGTGPRAGYAERVAGIVHEEGGPDAVGISGHTHDPMDDVVDGVRLLNPGSATGANPDDDETMLTVRVDDGEMEVRLHRE